VKKPKATSAFSSNLLTALLVGSFVSVVVIALVWANVTPGNPAGTTLDFQEAALFAGNPSTRSLNAQCSGAAELEVYINNPAPYPVTIQNVTISGSNLKQNATVLLIVSNSCLTVSESAPSVPNGGDYELDGYVTASIVPYATYHCFVYFSNGQILNQTLDAQT
jgi:hypothetical protein